MAYTNRESKNAGPSHTRPTKRSIKKRSPKAMPMRLYERVVAAISGGIRVGCSFTS
jgi:hypothetical protein